MVEVTTGLVAPSDGVPAVECCWYGGEQCQQDDCGLCYAEHRGVVTYDYGYAFSLAPLGTVVVVCC